MKKTLVIFLLLASKCVWAQGPAGALAIGGILDNLMDRVQTAIGQAEAAGQGIIIQGGSTLYLSIENAKVAYSDILNKTKKETDKTVQGVMDNLETLTTKFEKRSADDVSDIMGQAQLIINSFPLSNKQTQVQKFTPKYFAPSDKLYQIPIEISGNFVNAADVSYTPHLLVNGKNYDPSQITTLKVTFLVSVADLAPHADNTFNYTTADLTIPYKVGFIFKRRMETHYKLMFGVLPNSPGVIKIIHKVEGTTHEEQRKSTQGWEQYSSNDDITKNYCSDGFPGWSIKDPACSITWSQGNEGDQWSRTLLSTNPQVCYEIHTVHHRFGTSGKVNFHIDFTIQRDVPTEHYDSTEVHLKWGESQVFNYDPNSWKIIIDAFDGKHNEYSSSTNANYIEIDGLTEAVQLIVKNAADVVYP